MEPLVSVVIPCYNYGEYVEEAVDSVLSSSYENLEIIIVNDGSKDLHTLEVLEKLSTKPNTRVINRENGGLSAARNTGISKAGGDYLLFLDADDLIDPTFIEKGIWLLMEHKSVSYVYPLVKLFGKVNGVWETLPYKFFYLKFRNYIPATIIIRRSALEAVGGYDESMRHGYEDWEFILRLGKYGYYGLHMNEILFYYRKHTGSMLEGSKKKHAQLFKQIRQKHTDLYRFWIVQFIFFLFLEAIRRAKQSSKNVKRKLLQLLSNETKEYLKKIYFSFKKNRPKVNQEGLLQKNDFFQSTKENIKPTIMVILPWLHVGGVEKVFLQIVRELHHSYSFILITTVSSTSHPWEGRFRPFVKSIFHLGDFGSNEEERTKFLLYLIKKNDARVAHISNSQFGYKILPVLRNYVHTMDTLHMEEPWAAWDYFSYSKPFEDLIDIRVTLTSSQANNLDNSKRNVIVIPNGITPFDQKHTKSKDKTPFRVVFLARLAKQKQPLLFLKIAKVCQGRNLPMKFLMYGDGELKPQVIKLMNQLDLGDYFELHPFTEDVYGVLTESNILCLPSLREGFPMIGLEAMSAGVPVVTTNVPGWLDLITNGKTGFLCESNPEALADACENLFKDPIQYKEISKRAQRYVHTNLTVQAMVKRYDTLYKQLIFKGELN